MDQFMTNITTGGSGVIDLIKLSEYKSSFGFFAQQLAYPNEQTVESIQWEGPTAPSVLAKVQKYIEAVQELGIDQLEELYVQTFDFQKKSTLHMTYAKFEDGKERGQMLAKLKATYEMFGLEISTGELSDYLPLMCEFLYAADWEHPLAKESFQTLLGVLEDGTYALLKSLEKYNSPYYDLVQALREIFKLSLQKEVQTSASN